MYIYKRNQTYYYGLSIPHDLKILIPLKEIRFSLHTTTKKEDIHSSSILTSNYYKLFSQLRSGLHTQEESKTLINRRLYLNINQLNLNTPRVPIHTLEELSNKYSEDKMITNTWTDKTFKAYTSVFSVFSKVVNVKQDIKSITRAELQSFKAVLLKLPPMKSNHIKLTIEEILSLNLKVLGVATSQKYLSFIVSLFKWCEVEGYINKSIASGLIIKDDKHKKESRVHYSIDDLNILYTKSLLYTKDLHKVISQHPERVFLPLISMYQGMRLNEIAQLYTDDVRLIDGVYCFDINLNTPDKRLKNKSAPRIIPIHKELIELGFIDYYKKQKKMKKVRLWSELSLGLEGYGTNFRKWYGIFNRKHITEDKTKTFHSFRHLFTHTLKQRSLSENIDHFAIKYLLGHSVSSDITVDVYTHGYNMKELAEVVNKLRYEGLVLDELKLIVNE